MHQHYPYLAMPTYRTSLEAATRSEQLRAARARRRRETRHASSARRLLTLLSTL